MQPTLYLEVKTKEDLAEALEANERYVHVICPKCNNGLTILAQDANRILTENCITCQWDENE